MSPGERVARANRAAELLRELDWVFTATREKIVSGLESSALGDVDTHHNLAISLQSLRAVRSELLSAVNDGKMALAEQEQDNWIRRMKRRMA